jgi:hypothetical protein
VVSVRRREWQAPPGWPSPPSGWSPPAGWLPGPSWPPAPEGWQWWRQTPRTRWQRLRFGLLIGLPTAALVTLFALLIAAQVADDRSGCGSVDLTDPANYSAVTILNDTSGVVVIDDCAGAYCQADKLPVRVALGGRFSDDAACGVSGTDMTSWRVTGSAGNLVGYIAVDTPRKHDGLVFHVSRASSDRRTPTPPG